MCNQCVSEEYISVVKVMCHHCKAMLKCAAGISKPLEVGHRLGLFLFAIIRDALKEGIRKEVALHPGRKNNRKPRGMRLKSVTI